MSGIGGMSPIPTRFPTLVYLQSQNMSTWQMKVGLPQDVNIAICRPFLGHSKAVRDISFNNSGAQFLSAAYDRYVKLWDTETGRESWKNVFIFVNVTVNFYSDLYFPVSIYMTHTLQGSALDVLPTEKFRIVSSLILTR